MKVIVFLLTIFIIGSFAQPIVEDSGALITRTYDWSKLTRLTTNYSNKNNRTYDWSQYTRPTKNYSGKYSRTTYDWGQHTRSTTESSITTTTDGNNDDNHHNQYRCGAGKYSCAGTIGLCIDLQQICDQRIDCPHGDDENPDVCHFNQPQRRRAKILNRFSGVGFQFQIGNLKVNKGSKVKLFNQDSDNNSLK